MSKSKSRNTITTGCIKYAAPTPAAAALQHHWKLFAKTQGGGGVSLQLSFSQQGRTTVCFMLVPWQGWY